MKKDDEAALTPAVMADIENLTVHPAVESIPRMSREERERLKEDINRLGIREALDVTIEGKVWDGRHRLEIAIELGLKQVPVRFHNYYDDQVFIHALRTAAIRRHLSKEAYAALIIKYNEGFRREREEGKRARAGNLTRGKGSPDVAVVQHRREPGRQTGRTSKKVAEETGIGERNAHEMIKIYEKAPEVLDAIADDKISVAEAGRLAELPPDEREQAIRNINEDSGGNSKKRPRKPKDRVKLIPELGKLADAATRLSDLAVREVSMRRELTASYPDPVGGEREITGAMLVRRDIVTLRIALDRIEDLLDDDYPDEGDDGDGSEQQEDPGAMVDGMPEAVPASALSAAVKVAAKKSQARINGDGVSIKGCKIIYAPAGQAGEYARLATNPYIGCGNGCTYCYVPIITKQSREEFNAGAVERENFLERLRKDAAKYRAAGITEQVLLCFTTDPYHPGDTSLTRETLKVLKEHGLGFCTLTKGGSRALRDLDLFRPERDAFATTLTSLSDDISLAWEPRAALPADRIETIKTFHEAGVFTWLSLEPVIDPETTLEIIRRTHSFVDLYKIGRMNYNKLTKLINWRDYTHRVVALLDELGKDRYIKEDLQEYLPDSYRNIKHRPQTKQ